MNKLTEQRLRRKIRQIIREEREYQLRQLSPGAHSALGQDTLGIPPSAVVDVKIIDNGEYMQADINRILFDLDRTDDIKGAKYELEKLMQKGSIKKDDEETETDISAAEPDTPAAEPADEPVDEPEV
jgi:hypothetical protein